MRHFFRIQTWPLWGRLEHSNRCAMPQGCWCEYTEGPGHSRTCLGVTWGHDIGCTTRSELREVHNLRACLNPANRGEIQDFPWISWFPKVFALAWACLIPDLPKLRVSPTCPQATLRHAYDCPGASDYSRQHPGTIPHRLEHSNQLQSAPTQIQKSVLIHKNR